jgi:hypothetical protein
MKQGKIKFTQKDAENTPAGGVVVGERDGQTMIYDDASLGGYFIGKLHKDGGIKMVNKSTGQPLEVQGAEVIITAPAVNDPKKHNFNGQMMTNREILSKINSDGGGVSFAEGGDIPAKIHITDKEYDYQGEKLHDSEIAHRLGMNSTLKKGGQLFTSGNTTYNVDAIYKAIKNGKILYKTKDVNPFAIKYPVYDKKYSETVKIDFRKPNGIMVKLENGQEVLIDGNHRMNNAYLKGRKTMKVYYISDPNEIKRFTKKSKFKEGGDIVLDNKRLISDEYKNKMASSTAKKEIRKEYNEPNDPFGDYRDSEHWRKYALPYDTRFDIEFKDGGSLEDSIKEFESDKYSTIIYREQKGNIFLPKNKIYFWVYDMPNAVDKLNNGEFDFCLFPFVPRYANLRSGFVPPIKQVWTKKYQKKFKGSENLLGIVEAFFDEINNIVYIQNMTVNPNFRRRGLNAYMINSIRKELNLDKEQVVFEDMTKEGELFKKSGKYAEGGHLSKGKSLKQIAEMHNVTLAHINEQLAKGLEVEKEHFSDFKERTMVAKDHLVENPNYYTLLEGAGLENGGYFDSKPFLDYYFEEIASFLKNQNNITLKDDYTFSHRGEKFVIHPMIVADKDASESIKVANFSILDSDDLEVGEIDFDASNKKKFNAYSDFFEWNNLKFLEGGETKKEDLVKDAKSGNTPARDLNNYNDVLDLEADGAVGADNGLAFANGGLIKKENVKSFEKDFLSYTNNTNYRGIYDDDEIENGITLEWGKYGYSVSESQQDDDYQMLLNASVKFNTKNIGKLYAVVEYSDKYNTARIVDYDILANDESLVVNLPEKYFSKLKIGRGKNKNIIKRLEGEAKKAKDLEAVDVISKN